MYKLLIYNMDNENLKEILHLSIIFDDYDELLNHIYYLERHAKRKKLKYLFKVVREGNSDKITLYFD